LDEFSKSLNFNSNLKNDKSNFMKTFFIMPVDPSPFFISCVHRKWRSSGISILDPTSFLSQWMIFGQSSTAMGKRKFILQISIGLSEAGITFTRAYCNVPVCGASRASLLTGIRPTYNRFLQYYTQADVETPNAVTIPEHFKNQWIYDHFYWENISYTGR
jgi:hypothetical protein